MKAEVNLRGPERQRIPVPTEHREARVPPPRPCDTLTPEGRFRLWAGLKLAERIRLETKLPTRSGTESKVLGFTEHKT